MTLLSYRPSVFSAGREAMPVIYQIDKARGTIRTECVGDVTIEEILDHFATLAGDPDCPGCLDVLLDLSNQTTLPKSAQLLRVAVAIRGIRHRVRFGACAVVAPTLALYGMLRVFQVFTEDLFRETWVFRSVEEAEVWLAEHASCGGSESDGKTRISHP